MLIPYLAGFKPCKTVTIEQLLVKYFYQQKTIRLQGIGTLTLKGPAPDPAELEKNRNIQIEGLEFSFDQNALPDDGFVSFFAQQKGKIKPLAYSDVESHFQLVKQLLNIGKAYEINGLGTIQKMDNGAYSLTPGNFVNTTDTPPVNIRLKERSASAEDTKMATEQTGMSSAAKKWLLGVLSILILGTAGWFVYKYLLSKPDENPVVNTIATTDSTGFNTDTAGTKPPVANTPDLAPVGPADSMQLKAYLRSYTDKSKALLSFKRLQSGNRNLVLETKDSVNFAVYLPLKALAGDTVRIKDSLNKFYAAAVTLQRQ